MIKNYKELAEIIESWSDENTYSYSCDETAAKRVFKEYKEKINKLK